MLGGYPPRVAVHMVPPARHPTTCFSGPPSIHQARFDQRGIYRGQQRRCHGVHHTQCQGLQEAPKELAHFLQVSAQN